MPDNVTNELLLEHLKTIQRQLGDLHEAQKDVATDLRSIKSHMAGFMQNEVAQDSIIASIKDRIDRIERRLELRDK